MTLDQFISILEMYRSFEDYELQWTSNDTVIDASLNRLVVDGDNQTITISLHVDNEDIPFL